jgi:hypothetical protein
MPNGRRVGSCGRLFISANMGTNRQPMCAAARAARMRRERGPLQNRVTPFGDVVAIPQRGLYTGNRGIIHDPATKMLLAGVVRARRGSFASSTTRDVAGS